MAASNPSFTSVASIPKLQGKTNYEEWRNAVQGFCEMNGLWRYMLGQIEKPAPLPTPEAGKVHDTALKEANEAKIMRWLMLIDSLRGVIRSTCNIEPMSHVSGIDLCSDMWSKFETLYRDTGFMERDAIFIRFIFKRPQISVLLPNLRTAWSVTVHAWRKSAQKDVPEWMFYYVATSRPWLRV